MGRKPLGHEGLGRVAAAPGLAAALDPEGLRGVDPLEPDPRAGVHAQAQVEIVIELDLLELLVEQLLDLRRAELEDVDLAVERYRALDEDGRRRFRERLQAFVRLYAFLAQVVPFSGAELEKFYVYTKYLDKKIGKHEYASAPIDLSESVALSYYRLAKTGKGALQLGRDADTGLRGPSSTGTGEAAPQQDALSSLIERMNARLLGDEALAGFFRAQLRRYLYEQARKE